MLSCFGIRSLCLAVENFGIRPSNYLINCRNVISNHFYRESLELYYTYLGGTRLKSREWTDLLGLRIRANTGRYGQYGQIRADTGRYRHIRAEEDREASSN